MSAPLFGSKLPLVTFGGGGYGTSGFGLARASMELKATENWTDTAQGASINFGTTANGGTSLITRVIIDHDGTIIIFGNVITPAVSSRIDHPLDPENKYLSHSFVESPEMMNIYNGNETTDSNGEAEVTLPAWFETMNRDFRYQLTVIGQFAQAIVAEKIKGNRFKVRTSLPNVEVSWQVTGVRQDPFANANRVKIEEGKSAEERGKYLHPEVYGQPKEKGLFAPRPEKSGGQQEQ